MSASSWIPVEHHLGCGGDQNVSSCCCGRYATEPCRWLKWERLVGNSQAGVCLLSCRQKPTTHASFQSDGIYLVSRDCWKIDLKTGASSFASAFSIKAGIESDQVALFSRRFWMRLKTPFLLTAILPMLTYRLSPWGRLHKSSSLRACVGKRSV